MMATTATASASIPPRSPRWGVLGTAALALVLLHGAAARGEGLAAVDRKLDPRLARSVTLARPRVYVGELLDELSRSSGVGLKPGDERDGAGDHKVTVFLKGVPLDSAMTALWSLMSYQDATWQWQRAGSPGSYRYALLRPMKARQLAGRLEQESQLEFERQADSLVPGAGPGPRAGVGALRSNARCPQHDTESGDLCGGAWRPVVPRRHADGPRLQG